MLFLKALMGLIVFDIVTTFLPFRTIHSWIRSWKVAEHTPSRKTVDYVCAAVNYACVWYPKEALCLQRSFVLTYLLRANGIAAQLVLGAQKLPFKAHAWVEVEGCAVNERSSAHMRYAVWDRC